jgi:hypothetical protein
MELDAQLPCLELLEHQASIVALLIHITTAKFHSPQTHYEPLIETKNRKHGGSILLLPDDILAQVRTVMLRLTLTLSNGIVVESWYKSVCTMD